jgi:oligoribonuclease (3'-5' exoribonuclease)
MKYWLECIKEAFDDAGIVATDEQITSVAEWVEGAHENYGMAHGYDNIQNHSESKAERELKELKKQIEEKEAWIRSTEPCKICNTTGIVKDGWGRDVGCINCSGNGRY